MAKTEMTRVVALTHLIGLAKVEVLEREGDPELEMAIEVASRLRETLAKPRAKATGKTPARRENEQSVEVLYSAVGSEPFGSDVVMRYTGAMTPQKVVGIMKVGIALGKFEKFKDGKRTVYRKL